MLNYVLYILKIILVSIALYNKVNIFICLLYLIIGIILIHTTYTKPISSNSMGLFGIIVAGIQYYIYAAIHIEHKLQIYIFVILAIIDIILNFLLILIKFIIYALTFKDRYINIVT